MLPLNVLLCGDFNAAEHARWHQALAQAAPQARWLDLAQARRQGDDVHAAVVANPPSGSLQGLPALRLIQSLWAGVEGLLSDPSLPTGVPLARMVDPAMNAAMAQTALWATLALHRGFFRYAAQQRALTWQRLAQRRADEVRVSVLGLGQMGAACAQRLVALGYSVSGYSLGAPRAVPGVAAVCGAVALKPLLERSDIVINLLPLTAATRGLLDAAFFAALPRGASLVNLGRGAQVVDGALLAALERGHLEHAVLDVFQIEPLPVAHAYWQHPQVTLLPHAAAQTDERSAAAVVAANLRALASGAPLHHLVDRQRGY